MPDMTALIIPIAVTLVTLLVLLADLAVKDDDGRGIGTLAAVGLLAVLGVSFIAPEGVFVAPGDSGIVSFVQDAFALYVQRIVLVAGIIGIIGSIDHVDHHFPKRTGEYFLMILFSLIGMTVLAGARDLVTLIVAFELMGVPLYVLAAMAKKQSPLGIEGAWKLYLTGAVSSAITLYGMSFVVGVTNTVSIDVLAQTVSSGSPMVRLGMMLMLGGVGFKIGAVPFHMWVPDTYQSSPTPFVAFLSTAPKAAGFAVLARIFLEGFGELRSIWWPALLVVCVATMVVGNIFALPQRNVKRLLAYSGIAHIGLLILALGIGTVDGLSVVLFYLLAYVFTNMGAFLVADVVGRDGSDELEAWAGLAQRAPALGLAMLIFLLSLGGIPFVAGFWAKLFLFIAAWKAGMAALVILGAIFAVVGLFYYMHIGRSIYIAQPLANAASIKVGRPTAIAIGIALIGVLGMGLYPGPFVQAADKAAARVVKHQ
jgi:NADH-quinone oxidoreductase subunit N